MPGQVSMQWCTELGRWIWMKSNPGEGMKLRDVKTDKFSSAINYQHTGGTKRHAGTWEGAGPLSAQASICVSSHRLWTHSLRRVPKRQVTARKQSLQSGTKRHFGTLHRDSVSSCQLQHSCERGYTEKKKRCLTVLLIFIPFFSFTSIAMSIWAALNWYTNFTITMIELY